VTTVNCALEEHLLTYLLTYIVAFTRHKESMVGGLGALKMQNRKMEDMKNEVSFKIIYMPKPGIRAAKSTSSVKHVKRNESSGQRLSRENAKQLTHINQRQYHMTRGERHNVRQNK